jgi:hypothetical protein
VAVYVLTGSVLNKMNDNPMTVETAGDSRVTDTTTTQLSKRPTSSRGEGVVTKRVALGVLDSNARRCPRSEKGKNSRYSHVEYVL